VTVSVINNKIDIYERPWFMRGIGGAKNLVVVIDTSSSIGDMGYIVDALDQLISSLRLPDMFGIVLFNQNAEFFKV
jgi:hypothetical protein